VSSIAWQKRSVTHTKTYKVELSKFPIYAALGMPEIWLYDGQEARFYQLSEQSYQETPCSLAFPALTAAALTEFLAQSKTSGQTAALAVFRRWLSAR